MFRSSKLAVALRAAAIVWSVVLLLLANLDSLTNARPGHLAWGPARDYWAIAIAISNLEHGLKGKIGYRQISLELTRHLSASGKEIDNDPATLALVTNPDLVDRAIKAAAAIAIKDPGPIENGGFVTSYNDDIGYSDFYRYAFALFGYSANSTLYLYYLFLGIGLLLYVLAYRNDNIPIATLAVAVAALFIVTTSPLLNSQIPSFASNRFLSTLGIVPLLHLVMAALRQKPLKWWEAALVFVQCTILALVFNFRSAATWMAIGLLVLVAGIGIMRHWYRQFRQTPRLRLASLPAAAVVAAMLLACMIGASAVQKMSLHPIYSTDEVIPHHDRWHAAWLGLTLHPQWPQKKPYAELPDTLVDTVAWLLIQLYMREHHPGVPVTSPATGDLIRTGLHERMLREAFFRFAANNPRYMLELYGYYKPTATAFHLKVLFASIRWVPWLLIAPSLLLAIAIAAGRKREFDPRELSLSVILVWASSLLPVMWAWSGTFEHPSAIPDQLWSTLYLCLMGGVGAACLALDRARNKARQRADFPPRDSV